MAALGIMGLVYSLLGFLYDLGYGNEYVDMSTPVGEWRGKGNVLRSNTRPNLLQFCSQWRQVRFFITLIM